MGSGNSVAEYSSEVEALADGKTQAEIDTHVLLNTQMVRSPPETRTPCSKAAAKQGRSAWDGARVDGALPGLRGGVVTAFGGAEVRLDSLWAPGGLVLLYIRRLG